MSEDRRQRTEFGSGNAEGGIKKVGRWVFGMRKGGKEGAKMRRYEGGRRNDTILDCGLIEHSAKGTAHSIYLENRDVQFRIRK